MRRTLEERIKNWEDTIAGRITLQDCCFDVIGNSTNMNQLKKAWLLLIKYDKACTMNTHAIRDFHRSMLTITEKQRVKILPLAEKILEQLRIYQGKGLDQ